MSFLCCGKKYSKNDNATYWCITTDYVKKNDFIKKSVNGEPVQKVLIETLICTICGCLKVQIKRFSKRGGKYKVLEVEKLSGEAADLFLINTKNIRIEKPQVPPMKSVPCGRTIPLSFGKAISGTQQRVRYEGDHYWDDMFDTKNGRWIPKIIESELVISKV